MTVTSTATRSMRIANETALSGAETLTHEVGTVLKKSSIRKKPTSETQCIAR